MNYPFLTRKERDIETGLDFFDARYYSSTQGRFTRPDPLLATGTVGSPQNWNRYSYCINDPLAYVDPSGLIWGTKDLGNGTADNVWFETEEEMKNAGYAAMTNFLARNPKGGYYSFDRFSNHYEQISTAAVAGGLFSGETGLRASGVTSQSAPFFHLLDPVANLLDSIYRDPKVQGFLRSHEVQFLSVYSGVAGIEFAAAQGFASARGFSLSFGQNAGSLLQRNKAAGDAFRDEMADLMRSAGRDVQTEVYKTTPFGPRVVDIEVSHQGKLLGGIETKVGASPYKAAQQAKDTYLRFFERYPMNLVRKPRDK